MKLLKKLNNPFFLGFQGFLVGAGLFFATHPDAAEQRIAQVAELANPQGARTGA